MVPLCGTWWTRGGDPDPEDLADAVETDADGDVSRAVLDLVTITDLDDQGIEVDDRIDQAVSSDRCES